MIEDHIIDTEVLVRRGMLPRAIRPMLAVIISTGYPEVMIL